MKLENYILYYKDDCPYCKRVLRFMEKNNITCEMKDTSIEAIQEELIKIGGKKQVPCLVKDKQVMYESMDIIQHLNSLL